MCWRPLVQYVKIHEILLTHCPELMPGRAVIELKLKYRNGKNISVTILSYFHFN